MEGKQNTSQILSWRFILTFSSFPKCDLSQSHLLTGRSGHFRCWTQLAHSHLPHGHGWGSEAGCFGSIDPSSPARAWSCPRILSRKGLL